MSNQRRYHSSNPSSKSINPNKQQITFLLVAKDTIGINIPYLLMTGEVRNVIKCHQSSWNGQNKLWEFPLREYKSCFAKIDHFYQNYDASVRVVRLSDFVLKAQQEIGQVLQIKNARYSAIKILRYQQIQKSIDPRYLNFYDKLYDFQKVGVQFGIKKHGRVLLADEMGVGKTIQSLAIACIYRHQWPLLIICPSSLRLNWQQQILNWMVDMVVKSDVQVYIKTGQTLRQNIKILIISYDLAWKNKQLLQEYKVAIVDEAHYLKNQQAKRSQFLVPYLSSRKRVILLTGTPALAKPKQIFNLLSIIRPDVFVNFNQFGYRYCQPQKNPWSRMIQFNGCKNTKELHYILKDNIMIRRMKKDVLTQLPDKQRQKIIVQTNKNITRQIKELLTGGKGGKSYQQSIMNMFSSFGYSSDDPVLQDKRQALMRAYSLTGLAKLQAVKEYVSDLLTNNQKLLIFAHHRAVLDGLQQLMVRENVGFIRIDGGVSNDKRHQHVIAFQQHQNIKVALLSISAAGVGLTLTASSTVIFAELHWTPGIMLQAQDRAHRIGQKNCVNCHYLIGQNTIDQILYHFLQKKLYNVSSFVDGKSHNLQMQTKGKIQKISKKQKPKEKQHTQQQSLLFNCLSLRPVIEADIKEKQPSQFTEISDSDISEYQCEQTIKSKKRLPCDTQEQQQETSEIRLLRTPKASISKKTQRISEKEQQNVNSNEERRSSELCDFIMENGQKLIQCTQSLWNDDSKIQAGDQK